MFSVNNILRTDSLSEPYSVSESWIQNYKTSQLYPRKKAGAIYCLFENLLSYFQFKYSQFHMKHSIQDSDTCTDIESMKKDFLPNSHVDH